MIANIKGHQVEVATTHQNHFRTDMKNLAGKAKDVPAKVDFFTFLQSSLSSVNEKDLQAEEMAERMVTNPEEVEVHDVMIALEKAKMALNLTRVIRDSAIKSYREITNLR